MTDHLRDLVSGWSPGQATDATEHDHEPAKMRGLTKDEGEAYGEILDTTFNVTLSEQSSSPAAEASGEATPAVVHSVFDTFGHMLGEIDSKRRWMEGSVTELREEYDKVLASRDALRARLAEAEQWRNAHERG